ncbi:helix-turn-helix domain-containing protein [Agrobacterium pusense]|uniref:Helix-turn-helix domain protein (Modular protein) n=1 Tax=Agrobacterium pusense TaxID=648995 RepID=U4PU62_9HYPH|nr:helix-turn-helix transcriptional regulator [Agrobacterium pusense]CDI08664.1 Helix-turn-helix domain protein (modular protein) [Agrobacterium pusense]
MLNIETMERPKRSGRTIDQQIGAAVRDTRKARGMSQTELGNHIHVTFQQVQKYEKGTNRVAVSTLLDICRALDVAPIDILAGLVDPDQKTEMSDILQENKLLRDRLTRIRDFIASQG